MDKKSKSKKKVITIDYTQDAQQGKGNTKQRESTKEERETLAKNAGGYLYKCEECGEYHELEDLPEFGAHDEYEEVSIAGAGCRQFSVGNVFEGRKWKKWKRATIKYVESRGKLSQLPSDVLKAWKQFKAATTYDEALKAMRILKESPFIIENMPKIACEFKTGRYHNEFTSEPIPDYIMRALQPKKSVHPEYGKLRY